VSSWHGNYVQVHAVFPPKCLATIQETQNVLEDLSGADRRKLVGIANENQAPEKLGSNVDYSQ